VGGARVTWRLVRQVVLLMTVAVLGVLAIAPAVASSSDGDRTGADAGAGTSYRVALTPAAVAASGAENVFVATVETSDDGGASWGPAAGEAVTFAYVTDGAGSVVAVNGGPVGSMSCATDAAGRCTVTVRTDAPGDAALTATAQEKSASLLLG
jgi:hypothetical protein